MPKSGKINTYTKELFFGLAATMAVLTIINILAATIYVFMIAGPIIALLTFAALMTLFLVNSFHYVDPRVPHKWMPMIFGTFVNHLGDPGWIFIPFKGLLFLDYVLMYGGEMERVFNVQEVIPGDRSSIKIPLDVYINIDPENPAQIIEVGGLEAAITRLENIIIQKLRYWITSTEVGPQTMNQARQMREEVINTILESLLQDDILRIPFDIPVELLYGIYKKRLLSPKEKELKAIKFDPLPQQQKDEILSLIGKHLERLRSAENGSLPINLQYLGLVVRRFGVNNIEPIGSTIENVNMVNKAKFEAEKRLIDAKGIAAAAKKIAAVPGVQGDPLKAVLISEGLVKENVNINRYELSPEIIQLLRAVLGPLGTALTDKLGRKE